MNNIYKVIWSKAKNCYVVASEIARSHTKSASGSEKIGGVARHALLALGAVCAIACGGFVNVGAADTVEAQLAGGSTATVYTKEGTELYVADQIRYLTTDGDVLTNKNNIAALQTTTTDQGQKIATNTANIANNAAAIAKKIDTETAEAKLALKANAAEVYTKTDADGKFATSDALNTAKTDLDGKIAANTTKITAHETAITDLKNKAGTTDATVNDLSGRMAAAESDIDGLQADMSTAKSDIGTLKTKDTELSGRIDTEINNRITSDTALDNKINAEISNRITSDTALDNKIDVEINNRIISDTALDNKIDKEIQDRDAADAALEGKITTLDGKVTTDIADLKAKDTELEGKIQTNADNIQTNKNDIAATNKRTSGIEYDNVRDETTIEGHVVVDSIGNVTAKGDVTAKGKLIGDGVAAGAGDITTTGAVNAGSLNVENASHLKGDVTMDKTLSVTGDTKLKKTDVDGTLNVTGASSLKNTKVDGTLTTTGKATFQEAVEMDKGLTVTGDTKLKATTVDGKLTAGDADLKNTQVGGTLGVTGATTLSGELKAEKDATFEKNVTVEKDLTVNGKLNVGEIYLENNKLDAATGKKHDSATAITADGISNLAKVTDHGHTTESQFTHNEKGTINYAKDGDTTDWTETRSDVTANGVKTEAKDSKGNYTNTSQTADGIKGYATDKAGNKTYTKVTATENSFQVQDKDGKNKNHQVNTMDSSVTEIKNAAGATTKTEQTAENITNTAQNGTITNDAQNIVNNASGNMTNTVGSDLTTTVGGNELHEVADKQTNKIDGDQENTIGGNQTTTVTGDISNKAENITNEANTKLTDKVGDNTRVLDSEGITDTVPGADGKGSTFKQRIDAIMGNVKTDAGESEVTQKGDEITSVVGKGEATNSRVTQKKGSLEAAVTDGTNTNASYDVADASAKVLTGGTKVNKLQDNLDSSEKTITNGTYTTSKLQTALDITNTAKDGTITNDAKDIVNNASGNMTNTVGGDLTTTVTGNELHEVTGTKTENVTGKVTENYGNGQETNVTGDQYLHVTGKQTNKIDGDQENTIGGNQTTTVTGDISNKAENITNEANTKLTDKVGDHTRVLDSEGITDTVGGSTFKQRIDKIMMESKDVSIKAEETLTNEAKVITNKASEVINNEAVNINNTATGIITSKASEIKNQADKLISNKVGENTWENMENGKITTSIKDGAKQNLTQSDAAGTTQSTVDGGKSTVTIQNADGLADAVTDGTNTSVQNQTASAIAVAVKDGAGNENASVANATTSVNTIKSGSKANTVISTADGTSFINSEAAAPVGDGTEVKTTIKGNTITTGKVTMDYAEVMKDLGVRGNANITGKTTTGSLEVTGTSTLKGDVTMESNATVKKDLTVEGNTNLKNTKVDGTLDVTQKATFGDSVSIAKDLSVDGNATIKGDVTAKSYKVGDKTYISAAGINANDQKITNVADGSISEGSKDAVNGGQLYTVKNDLEGKVNKVGANAAAMANLHPMEFDPDSKWNVAAAIGNYGSESAAALGAFYRPNDDVMVNLSTTFGTGENMVGGGVSVRLGKGGNKLSREENNALKDQVNDLTARMDALLSVLNPNMSKDFPDVPENHWAYEAVSRLAGNDIVQGYPDGEFHGERTMTRYEMAEIIYNALSRGAEAEKELVEEFKPELQAMAASEKATAEKAEG